MPNIPFMMPLLFVILLLLPVRLSSQKMKSLAFFLWLTGGLILCFRGINFLLSTPEQPSTLMMIMLTLLALAIGFGKGKFVLAKTSRRNIERIDQFTELKRPIQVYSARSWIIIALMVGISVALNIFNTPLLWRGTINLAIGFALAISSLTYLRALGSTYKSVA